MPTVEEKSSELMVQVQEIMRRYRRRQRDFVKEVDSDLNHREIDTLIRLGLDGECTMSQLAQEIVLSMSSATMIVDKLVQKKIVSREHSSADRRVVMIRLTPGGTETFKTIYDEFVRIGRTMLESLNEHEQDTLLHLYRKIASKLE